MKIAMRLCLEDYTVTDSEGTSFTLERGEDYTTADAEKDGQVFVFTRYWFWAPADIFGGKKTLERET